MFRFTIRDVLWLTVVAAVCCAWFLHVRSEQAARQKLLLEVTEAHELTRWQLEQLKQRAELDTIVPEPGQ